jgi:sugar lactone lactonase YvrE
MIGTDGARTVQTIVSSGLSFPTGIAVGGDGTLYVADTGNHRVVRILGSSPWTVSALASGFYSPMGVAVAGSDVYVTDSGNNRLVRISSSGSVSTVVGDGSPSSADGPGSRARLNYPTGVAYGNGALWVVETQNHALRRVALDGAYTTATVTGGNWAGGYSDGDSRTAAFLPMFGVAISNGSVLIADTGNNRIRRVSAAGATSTFAGTGGGGAIDGSGASATVTLPFGIAVLPNGDVVVADEGASTIRVLHP